MTKFKTFICLLLFSGISVIAQEESENISNWYNSLKSVTKANDKAIYLSKMLELKQEKIQPQMSYLIDVSIQMVTTTFAEEGNFKKAQEYVTKIKDAELKNGTDLSIAEILIENKKFQDAHIILDPKVASITSDSAGNKTPDKNQLRNSLLYGKLLLAEERNIEALHYLNPSLEKPVKLTTSFQCKLTSRSGAN